MNNIKGYNIIAKDKKVSDLFLGTLDINWKFAKIGYNAICTEALPLTFLEKMVCGIVDLDGKVYLNDLAQIMGFNIEDDVQNLKFQDKGETEILMETLRTLKQFGVISTPDDSYTYVELTDIGKEYYAKGRKFKQGESKGFTMYFDLTAGEHAKAKDLFGKISVDGSNDSTENVEVPYADEGFVKKYAEAQIPLYYSEKTGNSFTDMSVTSSEFLFKKVVVGVIYEAISETYRFEIIDNGGIDSDYITNHVMLEENHKHYLELFLATQPMTSESKSDSQIKFEEDITKVQADAEYALFSEKPEQALMLVSDYASSPEYMEKQNLFNFIQLKKKENGIKDVFISLPTLSEDAESEISALAKDGQTRIMLSCGDLEDFDTRFGDNVLVLNGDSESDVVLMLDDTTYRCENLVFSIGATCFNVEFLRKQKEDSSDTMENIRQLYATRFIPDALDKYETLLQEEDAEDIVERINVLNDADGLVKFAESYVESTGNGEILTELRNKRDEQILALVQKYSTNMLEELDNLRANTVLDEIVSLDAMEKAQAAFSELKGKMIPEQSRDHKNGWGCSGIVLALNDSIISFESQLNNREVYLRQELLPKSYIVDTNVFVYFPDIMDYLGKDDKTIVSLKVLDELDKLKGTLDGKSKRNVKKAIKEINHKIRMQSKTFRMESADTRLLPEDFDKTNPDNMILSVALKYRDRNPFLVTNDINFQNRAASMGIPFKGLVDLLPEDLYQTIDFTTSEKKKEVETPKVKAPTAPKKSASMPKPLSKVIRKAYRACSDKADEVLVAQLVSEIKVIKPDFKPNNFGFSKFKELCEAYPLEIALYENSDKALCLRLIESDDEKESGNLKDVDSLRDDQQAMLKELLVQMIADEDPSAPVSDGDIRRAFIKMSGVNIKLKPVKQMRESLNIPSEKQRKNNFMNK